MLSITKQLRCSSFKMTQTQMYQVIFCLSRDSSCKILMLKISQPEVLVTSFYLFFGLLYVAVPYYNIITRNKNVCFLAFTSNFHCFKLCFSSFNMKKFFHAFLTILLAITTSGWLLIIKSLLQVHHFSTMNYFMYWNRFRKHLIINLIDLQAQRILMIENNTNLS